MFRVFETEEIRVEQDGELVAAGYRWTEPRPDWMLMLLVAGVLLGFGTAGMGIVAKNAPTFILGALVGLGCIALGVFAPPQRREVIFHIDGTIETPHGFPGYRRWKKVDGHTDHIQTIAARPIAQFVVVIELLAFTGHTVWLGKVQVEHEAFLIQRQLNIALKLIRDAQGYVDPSLR